MFEKIQIIHEDFRESFEEMSYESVGRVLMALIAFANDEDVNEILGDDGKARTLFPAIRNHVIRNEKYRSSRSNNGKKGGGQFGNTNATKNEQKRAKTSKNEQKRAPNLTLPNLTNNNIVTARSNNKFNDGISIRTDIDFDEIEQKLVKN